MSDDDRAVRILRTIPDEPPSPSQIDIPRTMAEGRRRRRARRWSGGVALAAVTAVAAGGGTVAAAAMRGDTPGPVPPSPTVTVSTSAAAVAPALPVCTVKLLPTGTIKKAVVSAGDPSGHYLTGRVYPAKGQVRTVIWKDGTLQSRPSMPGADGTWEDINSAGVAVGTSFKGEEERSYVSTGATVTPLRGGRSTAHAIGEDGRIAGTLGDPYEGTPAVWPSATAEPVPLPLPPGFRTGEAKAIDDDGTVVGTVAKASGEGTGYLWRPDGSGRLMPLPTKATLFWPESVSNGWIYGSAVHDEQKSGSRTFASYRYNIASGQYQPLPIDLGPFAAGAANGWVLTTTNGFRPVLVVGQEVVPLPRYNKMSEYVTSALSADGRVAAGYTTDTTSTEAVANRPLMWTCH
ncbi:hypothetical protein ACQPZJ_11560 [Actinoplanes sp. CA-054009]